MDESKGTPKAVILSAILHIGIVVFLFLATLPCSSYENFIGALGLPAWMNPITCTPPLNLQGQVIQAVLIGPTGSPPPKTVKTKQPDTVPPVPSTPPPPPKPDEPKIKTLPPPPVHPDTVDQEKVVENALQKADDAKKLQDEKQRQRQSELDAQAVKKKQEQQKKVDELLRQMDAAAEQTKKLDSKAKQAKQQLEDLASDQSLPNLPKADQLQSGNNSDHTDLSSAYAAAIQNAVTPNWLRPDNMPSVPCDVEIVQSPGGDVIRATAAANCPYDDAGKRSVENAVLRTKTLPYKGFESVFRRNLIFTFRPQ